MALAKEEGSVSSLQHPIEYPVSKSLLDSIQYEAYDWACVNGLVMYNKADLKLTHAPGMITEICCTLLLLLII